MAKDIKGWFTEQGHHAEAGVKTWNIDPEALRIPTDPDDPLYDPRSGLPLDASFVEDIARNGIHTPVEAKRMGDKATVVAGTQRVRAALYINEHKEKWKDWGRSTPVLVPYIDFKGSESEARKQKARENNQRAEDSLYVKAFNAERLRRVDKVSDAELCRLFRTASIQPINRWMEILTFAPKVQKAFDDGTLGASHIEAFSGLATDKQAELLQTMLAEGATKAHHARAISNAIKEGRKPQVGAVGNKLLGRPRIEKITNVIRSQCRAGKDSKGHLSVALAVLNFIQGNQKALDDFPEIEAAVNQALEKKGKET